VYVDNAAVAAAAAFKKPKKPNWQGNPVIFDYPPVSGSSVLCVPSTVGLARPCRAGWPWAGPHWCVSSRAQFWPQVSLLCVCMCMWNRGLCLMLALGTGRYLGTRPAWPPERRDRPDGRRKPGQPHGCARGARRSSVHWLMCSLADPSPAQLEEDPMSEADSDITLKELLRSPFGSLVP
jgi:hypothetical protein